MVSVRSLFKRSSKPDPRKPAPPQPEQLKARGDGQATAGEKSKEGSHQLEPPPTPSVSGFLIATKERSQEHAKADLLQEKLWNDAYDALKACEEDTVEAYEKLLSWHLSTRSSATGSVRVKTLENEIGQDRVKRRAQMERLVRNGLQQTEEAVAVSEQANKGIQIVNSLKDIVDASVGASPEAAVAWVGVCFVMQMLTNPITEAISNHEGLQYVLTRMEWYWHLAELLLDKSRASESSLNVRTQLESGIRTLYQKLLFFQMKSICRYSRSRAAVVVRDLVKWDDWDAQLSEIKDAEQGINKDSEQFNTQEARSKLHALLESSLQLQKKLDILQDTLRKQLDQQAEFKRTEEYQNCLRDLHITDPRHDKSRLEETKGGLLRDAYNWILGHQDFQRWHLDTDSRLLWIKGEPGKGKTMLVCGILDELQHSGPFNQLSFFFCQAADARLNSATGVLRGLMYQLVDQQPALMKHLTSGYKHAGRALFEDVNAWSALSDIFTQMLKDPDLPGTTLVVDGLDECVNDLSRLLVFITHTSPSHVKWLVSSRPWPTIEEPLRRASDKIELSLEDNERSTAHAVRVYIQHNVVHLTQLKGYDQPLRETVETYLVSNAHDTFLWVALVCKELGNDRVTRNSTRRRLKSFPPGLDDLYDRMLQQINQSDDADLCMSVLAVASVMFRPLALEELLVLERSLEDELESPEDLEEVIVHSGSFLTCRNGVVYFIHQSAKDFLLKKASATIFPSGLRDKHFSICSRSIEHLNGRLRRNIYNLPGPGASAEAVAPSPDPLGTAKYSCAYWTSHLCELVRDGGQVKSIFLDVLIRFFEQHFLHWLEALSLLGGISYEIKSMSELQTSINGFPTVPRFKQLLSDATRFINYHKSGIESNPLQVYSSALVFSPTNSPIRQLYRAEEPSWLRTNPPVADDWDTCLHTLEGHTGHVWEVAFSPDGQRLASSSADRTIKIWDPKRGMCLQTLSGHDALVNSVAYAPDGRQVASTSEDLTVRIWDVATGTAVKTFKGGDRQLIAIAFAPDGKEIATGSDDAVKIWDPTTGVCLKELKGHKDWVWGVAFSPDGRHLASSSRNQTVKIWNADTGVCLRTLTGHSDNVRSVVFSPDSSQLVSTSADRTAKIWQTETGNCLHTLNNANGIVTFAAFSPDGRKLALASWNRVVTIWDPATGVYLQKLEGHGSIVHSVAFSPDGNKLASAAWDFMIKIWDLKMDTPKQAFKAHELSVSSVVATSDGRKMASASRDLSIKIWDAVTGDHLRTLEGHSDWVMSVAFSPDDRQLVSGSGDKTVKFWDTETGACLRTLEGHTDRVYEVRLSPNGHYLASGSDDKTVKIWNVTTGDCLQTLAEHTGDISALAFALDSCLLATSSRDGLVKLWNPKTGVCLETLEGHGTNVVSLAFRPDRSQIASSSYRGTVKIWDIETGECLKTLEGHGTDLSWFKRESDSGYAFNIDGSWVTKDGQKLLWLPPDFRSLGDTTRAIAKTSIGIGTGTGRVSILSFDD